MSWVALLKLRFGVKMESLSCENINNDFSTPGKLRTNEAGPTIYRENGSESRSHFDLKKNSGKLSCLFIKLTLLVCCMLWVLQHVPLLCSQKKWCFPKSGFSPTSRKTPSRPLTLFFVVLYIDQLQNNWKKGNKSRRRTLMKCQSILAISLDLQNYLLRVHRCRYSIFIVL